MTERRLIALSTRFSTVEKLVKTLNEDKMKNTKTSLFSVIAFSLVLCASCGTKNECQTNNTAVQYETIVIDSCEYTRMYPSMLAHKGNCRFCEEREKQNRNIIVEEISNSVQEDLKAIFKKESDSWTRKTADHIIYRLYEEDADYE